ncbi:MAG: hypothetical protein K2Q24_17200 [Chitinophagaceae bacterium]|jgi:hypothetical protein|nr:hypothetical protein [Chitinophagaceae bacterium]
MKPLERTKAAYNRKDLPFILFLIFFALALFISIKTSAQKYQIAIFTGISNYQGDLQPVVFTFAQSQPSLHITGKIALNKHFLIRAGYAYGSLYANDRFNRDYLQPRNLNFRTNLHELHAGIELNMFDLETKKISPYVFAGIGVFRFNPYTIDNNRKVFLQPLGTEGQGLKEYPDRKFYSLTQVCIPIGYGIKYKINCNLAMSVEFSQRKLFTDYLDDLSKSYADPSLIAAARGPEAARFSWRGGEVPGGNPNAPVGSVRGNPREMDWYYFVGATVHINLVNCNTEEFILKPFLKKMGIGTGKRKIITRCPRPVL